MLDPKLSGKTAIVTGGNNPHGIGAAAARALAAQGAAVLIHYYRTPRQNAIPRLDTFGDAYYLAMQENTAQHVVDEIRAAGGRADSFEGDLGDPEVIPALFDAAETAFGPVQILVCNAAHSVPDTLLPGKSADAGDRALGGLGLLQTTLTAESHDRHFAVNSRATALMMAEFARRHIARGDSWGRIITISTDGAAGFGGEVSYGASKYAVESLSRAAAKEFGSHGITVNIASPGPIQTGWMGAELEALSASRTPLGRAGLPEDVADVVVLLASEQARWLTGQLLYVGGGHRMV